MGGRSLNLRDFPMVGVTPGTGGHGRDFLVGGQGGWTPAQQEEARKKELQMQALADLMSGGHLAFSAHNPANAKLDRITQEYAGNKSASTDAAVGKYAKDQATGRAVDDAIDYEETQAKALARARKIGLGAAQPFDTSMAAPPSYPNALAASGGGPMGAPMRPAGRWF